MALSGVDILYLGRNAPEIAALWPVENHAPLERLVLGGKVKQGRGCKDRATILPCVLLHLRFCPVIRIPSIAVPTATQPGIAKDRPFHAGDELKVHSLHWHGNFLPCGHCRLVTIKVL